MAAVQRSQYHVFSLPQDLLDALTPRNLVNQPIPPDLPPPEPVVASSNPRGCNICQGIAFRDVDEQRVHFKSDWHRYNVKTKMNGGHTVSEASFAQLVDGLQVDDSLSGSASSDDEDDDSDAVNTLINKTRRLARSPSPDSSNPQAPQSALLWFHSPPSTQIGVYKALLPIKTEPTDLLEELKNLQKPKPGGRTWAMFMVAGGHFAGALVRVGRDEDEEEEEGTSRSKKKPKRPKPDIEVIAHKTFHRYTTRRKQGGSQAANDNAKGPAKSAGAQLRRYGEQALRDDIRNLLTEWAEDIHDCERIWIRASVSNKKIFLDYEDAVIHKGDERMRTFPFPTRRPTQSELTRCLLELTKPKISHFTEDQLKAQDDAYIASLPKPKAVPTPQAAPVAKPQPVKFTKEEEALREKWTRLLEMVNKGRLEPLKAFWEREKDVIGGIDTPIPEWAEEKVNTVLQAAAYAGHADVVQWLLESARADPTITLGLRQGSLEVDNGSPDAASTSAVGGGANRTAYDLAKTKVIRDVFRRTAAAHLDWWDWLGAGHVPSVLSRDMEDEQEQKKKVRRRGLKDKIREREAKEKPKERPETPPPDPVSTPKIRPSDSNVNRLGGSTGSAAGISGLAPEMRMKVERERRARAAEARLKGLAGGK